MNTHENSEIEPKEVRVEEFKRTSSGISRLVRRRNGQVVESRFVPTDGQRGPVDPDSAEGSWLRSDAPNDLESTSQSLRVVDLFSGCGGLSVGAREAALSLGLAFVPALAVDFEPTAAEVFGKNFSGGRVIVGDVAEIFDSPVGNKLSAAERHVLKDLGNTDVLMGGPPCQGHSDLNNRTRRMDPKNELYFSMVRAAEVLEPRCVLIENVPGALNDKAQVVQRSAAALSDLGYKVDFGVVDASRIGVPQRRKRLLLLASRDHEPCVDDIESIYARPPRTLRWAIGDLEGLSTPDLRDEAANSAPATRTRIDYLFDHDLFDLPDMMRPACHRTKAHTYRSIYGRLRWDEPTQTITTGFYSMCMGRYVHPSERRTLTAREAARIQYFPDAFDFTSVTKRSDLAKMIGNAVPSRLAHAALLELLR
ncbi:MAG: DNA cytosine methyltransferase [Acidobacteria bacterium]|nr:DNA cytosine methyltransferase [Acidobacteriota bacterium]